MCIKDLLEGQWVTRDSWHKDKDLSITMIHGELWYMECGVKSSKVKSSSTAHSYSDFYLCNKGNVMAMEEVKVIVGSGNGVIRVFNTEELALEYIADTLKDSPRTTFYMFKPYQMIKPKPVDLSELIVKL